MESPGSTFTEADSEMIRALRTEVNERVKLQHQIAVLAGGSVAVSASLLGNDTKPSAWLLLGLSILFLAFGFSMLNQDRLIVTAVHFILKRGNDHAQVQAQWEQHLRSSNRDLGVFSSGLGASLRAIATYAIPVLGAVGSAWAFLTLDDAHPALVILPVVLVVVFLREVAEVVRAYQRLADVLGSGGGTTDESP